MRTGIEHPCFCSVISGALVTPPQNEGRRRSASGGLLFMAQLFIAGKKNFGCIQPERLTSWTHPT
jgi:hypothetical protein